MRPLLLLLFLACSYPLVAQSSTKTQAVGNAEQVIVHAPLSEVRIVAGTGNEVSVKQVIIVNEEARPELGKLQLNRLDNAVHVEEIEPTIRSLRRDLGEHYGRAVMTNGEVVGDDQPAVQTRMIVSVPAGLRVLVSTEYGDIEAVNLPGLQEAKTTYGTIDVVFERNAPAADLELESTYGAVDLTLPPAASADLRLCTKYGELLTDFDLSVDEQQSCSGNFSETVVGTVGRGGSSISCKSPYGNVYLRQSK